MLGDDLVIFDLRVKTAYLRIIAALGVECGIAKSLLSPKGLAIEFAKRTLYRGEDISPIPIKEFVAANLTLADAIAFARKYKLSFPQLVKTLGYGYRVLGRLNQHVGQLNSRIRALLFAYHLPVDEKDVTNTLFLGNPLISKAELEEVVKEFKTLLMTKYYAMIEKRLKTVPRAAQLIKDHAEAFKLSMVNRLHFLEFTQHQINMNLASFKNQGVRTVGPDPGIGGPVKLDQAEFRRQYRVVDPSLFTRVEDLVRTWVLVGTRLAKLVIEKPTSTFVREAEDLLWDIKGLRFNRSLFTVYTASLKTLRVISALGDGVVKLHREDDNRLPGRADPVQMRYWRDFTKCILAVLKRRREANKGTTKD